MKLRVWWERQRDEYLSYYVSSAPNDDRVYNATTDRASACPLDKRQADVVSSWIRVNIPWIFRCERWDS